MQNVNFTSVEENIDSHQQLDYSLQPCLPWITHHDENAREY